jgi:hypothetical protein
MITILIHKPSKLRVVSHTEDHVLPKHVLLNLVLEMGNALSGIGVNIRKSERDEFSMIDDHGHSYRDEPPQNFHNFNIAFG